MRLLKTSGWSLSAWRRITTTRGADVGGFEDCEVEDEDDDDSDDDDDEEEEEEEEEGEEEDDGAPSST